MAQTNPVKAIKEKCLDCCCGQWQEVQLCPKENCALHAFRFGKNPYRAKREYSEEQLARMRERILKNRKQVAREKED